MVKMVRPNQAMVRLKSLIKPLSHYYNAQAKQFSVTSTVRDAHVGYWFEFNEHPK